jgi:hypothetical protein
MLDIILQASEETSADLLSNCIITVKYDGFVKRLRFWREGFRYASTTSVLTEFEM